MRASIRVPLRNLVCGYAAFIAAYTTSNPVFADGAGRPVRNQMASDIPVQAPLIGGPPAFAPNGSYHTNFSVASEAAAYGDFDGDGCIDAAIGHYAGTPSFGPIALFYGNCQGTFARGTGLQSGDPLANPSTTYTVGVDHLASADVNGDTIADVIALTSNGYVSVHISNGDRSFRPPVVSFPAVPMQPYNVGLYVINVNDDGVPDLVIDHHQSFTILLGIPFAIPGYYAPIQNVASPTGSLQVGDLTGDGREEIVISSWYTQEILIYEVGGAPSFALSSTVLALPSQLISTAIGDFNGDGGADILATGYPEGALFKQTASGSLSFVSQTMPELISSFSFVGQELAVGDLDNDGIDDAVWPAPYGSGGWADGGDAQALLFGPQGTVRNSILIEGCDEEVVLPDGRHCNQNDFGLRINLVHLNGDNCLDVAIAPMEDDFHDDRLMVAMRTNCQSPVPTLGNQNSSTALAR